MNAARGVALGALLVAAVVLAVLLLGGSSGTMYKIRFENAGQLVKGDDVQVGGRRMGSIETIELSENNEAEVGVKIEEDFAPLHEGTEATIRATSLSGIANRYIALTPGADSEPELDEGAMLGTDKTTSIVDLDQLFNTLDPETRRGLQKVIEGSKVQYAGNEEKINEAARYFNPAVSSTARLVNEINRDSESLANFLVEGSEVVTALDEKGATLTDLVTNSNTTAKAIGDEAESLSAALQILPPTMRRANTTFVNLRAALDDLDVLVNESKPATRDLAPFFRALRPLVADSRPTIADLRTAISQPGPDNDLIDLNRKIPVLADRIPPVFRQQVRTLRQSQEVVDFIRPYTPDLVGWFRDFGQTASFYDANGHYARISPIFNTFSQNNDSAPLPIIDPVVDQATRLSGFFPNGELQLRRCPGAATQARPDGGNPWRDADGKNDCDPTDVLPGP